MDCLPVVQVMTGTGPMQQYANILSVPYGVAFWSTIFLATAQLFFGLSTGEWLCPDQLVVDLCSPAARVAGIAGCGVVRETAQSIAAYLDVVV